MEPLTHIVRHVLSEFPVQSLFVNNLQSSLQCVVPKLQHAVVTIITTMCRGSAGGGSYFSTAGRGWQVGRGQVSRLIHTYLLQLLCSAGPVLPPVATVGVSPHPCCHLLHHLHPLLLHLWVGWQHSSLLMSGGANSSNAWGRTTLQTMAARSYTGLHG